jgi:hypothetical protein
MTKIEIIQAYLAAYIWKSKLFRYHWVDRMMRMNLSQKGAVNRISVWPPFDERTDDEALSDFMSNARYYLSNVDVPLQYYCHTLHGTSNNIQRFVMQHVSERPTAKEYLDATSITRQLRSAQHTVIWRISGKPRPQCLRPSKYIVAESPEHYEITEWIRLITDIYRSGDEFPQAGLRFSKLPVTSCAVLGTGPSVGLFEKEADQYDAWIGANAICSNTSFRHIGKPFAICILDPVLYGPFPSQRSFREGLFAFLRETPAIFITTYDFAAFIELYFPNDIKAKCHYVKTLGHDTGHIWTRFDVSKMTVTPYGNVLTDLMLPVASSISRQVVLYGCDGRPPDEHGKFPKLDNLEQFDKELEKDVAYPLTYYDTYVRYIGLYTRYVVDECQRQGVDIRLRRPSWHAGLTHLPVVE